MPHKKVIYFEFNSEHRGHIIDYLYEEHAWEPVLLSGHNAESMRRWVNSKHKECVLQETIDLRLAQFDYSKVGKPVPIDAEIISALSRYALNSLGFQLDSTGWNFALDERKRFYYDMLKYWNTVIHHLQPDLLVLFTWPHTPTEYPLYLLCKHYFNIDTLFIDPVPFFDRYYHFVGISLEELYAPFIQHYKSKESFTHSQVVCDYMSKIRSKKGKTSQYIIDVYEGDKKVEWNLLKKFVMLIAKTILCGYGFRKGQVDWKKNRKPYDLLSSRMNHFEELFFWIRTRRKNIRLRKHYKSYCVQPNFDQKYLYFAASYQPEAVSAINGGVFEDIFLALDILSACVPEDWVIYYKEHPGTFLKGFRGCLKRNKHFYNRVASYANVQIIPSQSDSFELIDASQAVATIGGTASWEAIVRGKPAISFGRVWYQGCNSVFSVETLQDAQEAIKKILSGYTPDPKDIERYAASIEKVAVKGMIHRDFPKRIKECRDPKFEMERIGKALYEAYERYYGAKRTTLEV